MTLTVARFLGLSRVFAARFVFMMATLVILGAMVVKGYDLHKAGDSLFTKDIMLGVFFSFIFSLIFLHCLLKWLAHHSLLPIIIYRVLLGIVLIVSSFVSN
jgi:undecaprenyl-diphosphatase